MTTTLRFPAKQLRAGVIAEYVRPAGYAGVVCFSCGNASEALQAAGLYVVDVSPRGALEARRWWQPEEIRRCWPTLFDATPGHLPAFLMLRCARAYRAHLGPHPELSQPEAVGFVAVGSRWALRVLTGSGETITCLRWAYPELRFEPVGDGTPATERHREAPLEPLIEEEPAP